MTESVARREAVRAAAVGGAAAAAVLVWVAAVPIAGIDLEVEMAGETEAVDLRAVVTVALGSGLSGWALLAALEWRVRRAVAIWTAVALAVTLLSLLGPLAWAGNSAARAVLVALHLVVAAVLIPAMRRTSAAVARKIISREPD
jgi:hypothetical protein